MHAALVYLALVVVPANAVFYIPTTSIDNTQAYYSQMSANWDSVRSSLSSQIDAYAEDKNYGVYVLMTSIYGAIIPSTYDQGYMQSLMQKFQDLGPRTWGDVELQSISSTYQIAHNSAYVINQGSPVSAISSWWLAVVVAGVAAALVVV
ncbi:hypothetical protein EC988_008628 [Linderina pennispora]|nr:hypothetical protein EC988_008628 [Linderina pennispora]